MVTLWVYWSGTELERTWKDRVHVHDDGGAVED